MTILFHVTLMTMLRHFESVLLALAERGHRIRVALPNRRPDLLPPPALADQCERRHRRGLLSPKTSFPPKPTTM